MDHKQTSNAATSKSKPKNAEKLNRFTSLPYLIDMLEKNELTLLDPSGWEDKNERITIEQYKEHNGYESIYALCMTDKAETYHHWNAFTNGDSGSRLFKDCNFGVPAFSRATSTLAKCSLTLIQLR